MSGAYESHKSEAGLAASCLLLSLGLVPGIVLAVLVLAKALAPLAAFLGWVVCLLAACILAILLWRDMAIMTRLVRALRTAPGTMPVERPLLIPGMKELGAEAQRLVHAQLLLQERHQASAAEERGLLERLPDPLIKLDHEGKLVWRNDSAITAFGSEMAAFLRHPALRAALQEAQSGGQPVRRAVVLAAPVSRDLDVTMIPVGRQFYVLVNDRTRERALEKMRADFVANSSHELRTPLASLIGFIETLQGPAADDPAAQTHFLAIMAEQAARMQRLIGDLLSLSKIEISEHSPPSTTLHPATLLRHIVEGMAPVFTAHQAELLFDVPAELPEIQADADQLTQVFTNLLDNAIKYGKPQGRVRLSASSAPDSRFPPGGVHISVSDDGPGIERTQIPRLTERFYRVDKGRSRAIGGTGLGLAIVKHVVNRHRGFMAIESAPGQGATFTVWLPGRQHMDKWNHLAG